MNQPPDETPNQQDVIWAPWRIDYILERDEYTSGCFFCEAFASEGGARKEHKLLGKNETYGLLLNKFPYNNGHALVAPVRHEAELSELTDEEKLALMNGTDHYCELVEAEMNPDGFNIGINLGEAAGAGVPDHLHVHIVPRWEGDTNFMPVTGGTNVIPQSLDELYDLLVDRIDL